MSRLASKDQQQKVPENMVLTQAEVVFLWAHNIHNPFSANLFLRRARNLRVQRTYPTNDRDFDITAGICQKVGLQSVKFRELYISAYTQGMFNAGKANPWFHNPHK